MCFFSFMLPWSVACEKGDGFEDAQRLSLESLQCAVHGESFACVFAAAEVIK